ncbi:MAG: NfeD family protein [Alistipes sp.]|jgi:membrane protein implicated in regulation of membrane protease activity|nr:NfeD family protein [Alistipes sp.]
MEIWHYWAIAALLLFVIELFTQGFAVICISIGAAGGAVAAAMGLSFEMQLVVFAIVTIFSIAGVRPLLKRLFHTDSEKVATNASALIGRRGKVCVAIDEDGGRVMIDGVDWKAVSLDGQSIAEGAQVEVVAIDSVILTVKPL